MAQILFYYHIMKNYDNSYQFNRCTMCVLLNRWCNNGKMANFVCVEALP